MMGVKGWPASAAILGWARTALRDPPMKILIAADGSRYTKRMLSYLAAHDEWWRSQAHRFTVLTIVPALPARAASALTKEIVQGHYAEEAEEVLKPIRKFFAKQGIEAEFSHQIGDPADQIAG